MDRMRTIKDLWHIVETRSPQRPLWWLSTDNVDRYKNYLVYLQYRYKGQYLVSWLSEIEGVGERILLEEDIMANEHRLQNMHIGDIELQTWSDFLVKGPKR